MDKDTLTTEEAAERLGVTATRVRAMIAAGRLPAEKFGPVYMVRVEDLKLVKDRKTGRPRKETAALPAKKARKKRAT